VTVPPEGPLDYADRWLRDGLQVLRPALMVGQITVDMTAALRRLDALRRTGVQATATHLLVRAAACINWSPVVVVTVRLRLISACRSPATPSLTPCSSSKRLTGCRSRS
jgi:hypothetical protein